MLEYARGLLWYMCREWHVDRRWYYDGWENPMHGRYKISHDGSCIGGVMHALPYLLAAGVDCDPLLENLEAPVELYRTLRGSSAPYLRGNRILYLSTNGAGEQTIEFVTFIQTTGRGAGDMNFSDVIPVQRDSLVPETQQAGQTMS